MEPRLDTSEFSAEELALLAEMADMIDAPESALADGGITPRERPSVLAPSFAQQRLWFLDQYDAGSATYIIPIAYRLRGSLNAPALERAIGEVVRRHEALRTTFATVDGRAAQVIGPAQPVPLALVDLMALPSAEREGEAQRLAAQEARRPFDLAGGPLLRATLLRLAADEHVLLLTIHHIAADGWSIGVLNRELAALYDAFCAGLPTPLPEPALQYADFAMWQREWLAGPVLDEQLAYWRQQLREQRGEPPLLELPTDRPRPAIQSYTGAVQRFALQPALAEGLRQLSRHAGATLYMTLLAAFNALLSRYTGQTDIVIGAPIAGRNRAEIEPLIGFFVNTLPLRTDLAGDPTFAELLGRVREMTLDAYAHQDVPFEKLVEALQPRRSLSHSPLFQVSFLYQNAPMSAPALAGLTTSAFPVHSGTSKFDITLTLWDEGQGLAGELEYNTDLFDAGTIARLIGHYATLLADAAGDPGRPISELALLTDDERRRILVEWNDTAVDYPTNVCLHELLEAQVERTPDAVAVTFEGRSLTYRELDRRANQVAHHLRRHGIGAETLVGISMERSLEMVVGLVGILKAGGAYVPFDPAYPQDRLAFMFGDARVPVLLTQPHLAAQLPAGDAQVVCLDERWEALADEPDTRPGVTTTAASLAYVIYTSGSTGKPKGAMNTHVGIVNRLLWMQDEYRLDASDRVLQKTPFSFDVSVWEFFWPLLSGARLVVARPGGHQDTTYLARLIASEQITTLHFVPSMLQLFLGEPGLEQLSSVRRVICSGEALPLETQERFFERMPLEAELHNLYGPTEAAVDVTYWACRRGAAQRIVPIGRPVANTQIYILDALLQPVPAGVAGELYLGGVQLARGYLNRPELTKEKFVPNPFWKDEGGRMNDEAAAIDGAPSAFTLHPSPLLYRTGDLARFLPDGNVEYLGRIDHQVKIRGFRIELGEIETVLAQHPAVGEVAVVAREDALGDKRLVAYITLKAEQGTTNTSADESDSALSLQPSALSAQLRAFLKEQLPEYMVPAAFVTLEALPLSPNGKLDRRALPAPEAIRPDLDAAFVAPQGRIEQQIAALWQDVLQIERVGVHDNFFDLGGHSLLLIQIHSRLREQYGDDISVVDLFKHTTVSALAEFVSRRSAQPAPQQPIEGARAAASGAIAIVGMSGRFPLACDIDEFWRNIRDGVESIQVFTDEELLAAGEDAELLSEPGYVRAGPVLEGAELFDAAFFGFTPREAEILDPQQRLFLEGAWEALEHAGYDSEQYAGRIGVYAGASVSSYLLSNLLQRRNLLRSVGEFQIMLSNDKDFLATRVSYKLNLTGPSINVNTACSTSLVAIHLARRSLLSGECDMALAGGVTVQAAQVRGYLHQPGGILSPDGHCRPFDAQAQGTLASSGVGVVVLKRLEDALADGDTVHAVIRGSALNNDGAAKIGFTAPSVDGQAAVIAQAQAEAGAAPDTIGYIEAHGTATALGDPVEIAALTQAFRAGTDRRQFCAVGSVKSNVGHTDTAAGVAGLIKATMALKHRQIPPSLHFRAPNPSIDFAASPFYVADGLRAWPDGPAPRRAGVSSFGIGGTNAHVVVEEAAPEAPSDPSQPWQLLLLSARSAAALDAATSRLLQHLKAHPDINLADAAHTLRRGRRAMAHRRALVARDVAGAVAALEAGDPQRVASGAHDGQARAAVFLFPGQGAQHVNMGRGLYESEPVFREQIDRCAELLRPHLGLDLRELLYPAAEQAEAAAARLNQTRITQPALFAVEYALARLWMAWGVRPQAMVGHSIGEYVAACLAGVMTLEDALALVAARGRLMQQLPAGSMLAVPLPEADLLPLLGDQLALAAVNAPGLCVVSGPAEHVDALERQLAAQGHDCRRLHTSHAFHSAMMDPILEAFAALVGGIRLRAPQIRYLSNVTGTWITDAEATDPRYYARHLRQTVRFSDGVRALLEEPGWTLLEVGPGRTLSGLARQHPGAAERGVTTSMRHPQDKRDDREVLLDALGRIWLAGASVDWAGHVAGQRRRRLPLPTYPFERQRYWIDAPRQAALAPAQAVPASAEPAPEAEPFALYERLEAQGTYVAPRDDIERQVASIWQELLGIERVGVHDNFFELGGHSLLATRLLARLRDTFTVELPVHTPFDAPTVEGLALAILQQTAGDADDELLAQMLAELEETTEG